jgi:IclR family transcriptional regulator, KDG regulon repressor
MAVARPAGAPAGDAGEPAGRRGQVAERALIALEALADAPGGLSVTELGRQLGVDKSTAHRLLGTMRARGFARLNPSTQRYSLGFRIISLGSAAARDLDLTAIARPFLEALSRQTGEGTSLAVLSEGQVLFLARVTGSGVLSVNQHVGTRMPAHCSALGKAMLAGFGEHEQIDRLLGAGPFSRYTPRTITSPGDLYRHLELVRQRGWALDDEEFAVGLRCLAAPLRDATGDVVAAVGISGPTSRITLDHVDPMAAVLRQTGTALSEALGYRPTFTPTPSSPSTG